MRKSKFNIFAVIGMVMALGTAAFTAPKVFNEAEQVWYYTINSMEPEDLNNPDNYSKNPTGSSCNVGTEVICSIESAENSSGKPAFNHGEVSPSAAAYNPTFRLEL